MSVPSTTLLLAIFGRILIHNIPGGILDGWSVKPIPVPEVDGQDNLPSIRIFSVDGQETGRSKRIEQTVNVTFAVSVKFGSGLVAVMEGVQKLMNAIETDIDGKSDTTMDNVAWTPIETVEWELSHITNQAIVANVKVEFRLKPYRRAARI